MKNTLKEAIRKYGYPIAFSENKDKIDVYVYSGLAHLNTDWEMIYIDEIKSFDFGNSNLPDKTTIVYMIDSLFDMNFFFYNVLITEKELENKIKNLGIEYVKKDLPLILDELKKIPTVDLDFFNDKGLNFGEDDSLYISEISGESIIINDLTNSKTIIISANANKNSYIPLNIEANKDEDWIEVYDYNFGDIDIDELKELQDEGYDLSVVINGDYVLEFSSANTITVSNGITERYDGYVNLFNKYFTESSLLDILNRIRNNFY